MHQLLADMNNQNTKCEFSYLEFSLCCVPCLKLLWANRLFGGLISDAVENERCSSVRVWKSYESSIISHFARASAASNLHLVVAPFLACLVDTSPLVFSSLVVKGDV